MQVISCILLLCNKYFSVSLFQGEKGEQGMRGQDGKIGIKVLENTCTFFVISFALKGFFYCSYSA